MSDDGGPPAAAAPEPTKPVIVQYDPVTGVPAEYNEFLPKDSEEYKKWKAAQDGSAAAEGVAGLKVGDGSDAKPASGKSKKQKAKPQIVLEVNTRNKKKSITTVAGLDGFGVKLSEAAKLFGKKFATGASVTKTAVGGEQIDMQGDFVDALAELILKQYGASHTITKADVFHIEGKHKVPHFDDDDDEDA